MKVALYLRMSTDKQDTSIPQQRAALERHANKAGYVIVREYRDEGISGDNTNKRQGFQQMIADAPAGDFDRILCFDQDRFGRFDMIEAGLWISPLRDAGVSLETIAQGSIDWNDFAGRLTYAVAQEGKHQFLRDLSRNCLRGNLAKARAADGMYGAPAPYGYRRESVIEGRRRVTKLVPHKFEATVVRRIFETYTGTSGTLLAVGELLNREQIPSPNGKAPWHRNAVRRILRNRTYMGDYVWGKTSSGKYFSRTGEEIVARRRGGRRMKNDPIVHEGILPALVSREIFEEAQRLLDRRRKATRRPGTVRPLSGLLTCGKCGSPMHVNFGDYRCSRSVDFGDGTRCPAAIARGEQLLRAIAEHLQRYILAPQQLATLKAKLTRLTKAEQKTAGRGDTAGLDRQIADLEKQISEGIARIPLLPKSLVPEMAKGLDSMRAQRDAIKQQRDATSKKTKASKKTTLPNRVADAIAAAYALPKTLAEGDAAAVNEGLRRLGVRGCIRERTVQVVIDLRGSENPVFPGRNEVLTCNARSKERNKSPSPYVIEFTVPIPAEKQRKTRAKRAS
jgi:DNA invertase Pin-like site-specific DNA recombinase